MWIEWYFSQILIKQIWFRKRKSCDERGKHKILPALMCLLMHHEICLHLFHFCLKVKSLLPARKLGCWCCGRGLSRQAASISSAYNRAELLSPVKQVVSKRASEGPLRSLGPVYARSRGLLLCRKLSYFLVEKDGCLLSGISLRSDSVSRGV